ncbi:MAG: PEP-CTERM system histidine kinase PrsK, partial [Planctomycetota bacterium]|nr:PEP-CTERM system histidine kinase PrsK [Planctomycetota bacterium]
GQVRVTVSHGLVYGSITLFTVGIYLVASSALATWLGKMIPADLELQTIFMVAAVVFLVAVLISRTFRFKLRHWIRRNVYSGKHDYRTSWLQATEGILATDRPERIAEVLGRLAQRSLGVLRVSVWLRVKQGDSCRLAHFCGRHPAGEESIDGVLRVLAEVGLPVSRSELREASLANDARKLVDLMDEKQVSLCVPLCSGEEVLGFLLVGADRQESEFGFDDREFLRVLATHAAGELHVQELLATQLEAKEAEAFNYFSTFLLHDLKNYSSTLRLIAGNAGRHIGNLEFQKDAFESVRQTAEKMTRLCNSLSTFSTNLAEHRKPEDLNRLMRSVVEELGAAVSARLRLELADLPLLSLDAEALTTVLRNLILNAFEAIDPEEGAILVTTRSSGSGTVELSVEDNGSGISREFLEKKLFSPFHTTKSAGLGVGLFHSKKIVEAHGGSIRVESEDGKGTVVTVQLPVPDDVPSERPSSRRQLQ